MKKLFLATLLILLTGSTAFAGHVWVEDHFMTRGHFFAMATVDACNNNPGPYVTLEGEITLSGLNGIVIFRNNVKGTHEAVVETKASVVLLDEGETIKFNKQPSQGGVGGNPWIYIQFFDADWNSISDYILMGRCVQGLVPVEIVDYLPTDVSLMITAGECNQKGGPNVTLNGKLAFGGLNAKLVLTNNAKFTHKTDADIEVGIVILDEGESITIAKQPPRGGAGGNPHIYFQFADSDDNPIGDEIYLGRCNKLGS